MIVPTAQNKIATVGGKENYSNTKRTRALQNFYDNFLKNIGDSLEMEKLCSPLLGRPFRFEMFVLLNYILFFIIRVRTLNFETLLQMFKYLSYLHCHH